MVCIGESDYFRYNNPDEENPISQNNENTNNLAFKLSSISKYSIKNKNSESKPSKNKSNFILNLIYLE